MTRNTRMSHGLQITLIELPAAGKGPRITRITRMSHGLHRFHGLVPGSKSLFLLKRPFHFRSFSSVQSVRPRQNIRVISVIRGPLFVNQFFQVVNLRVHLYHRFTGNGLGFGTEGDPLGTGICNNFDGDGHIKIY